MSTPNTQDQSENIIFQKNRLMTISNTLQRMEKKCEHYLKEFETSSDWKRFKEGFLSHNYMFKPHEVVEFQTCDLADKESSFYMPKKQKIMVCSNKIRSQEHFNTVLKYQFTLMYDGVRSNIDYNNCKQMTCMHVRALNLSQLCKRGDQDCFKGHINNILYQKPVCQGQEHVFDKIFKQCVVDISPYNTMKNSKAFFF